MQYHCLLYCMFSSVIQLGDFVFHSVLVRLVFSATYNMNKSTSVQTKTGIQPFPIIFKDNMCIYYCNVKPDILLNQLYRTEKLP